MAKDVVTFLNWAAEPEHDERKKIGLKGVIVLSGLLALSLYVKRFKFTHIKSRKLSAFLSPITCIVKANIHPPRSLQPPERPPLVFLDFKRSCWPPQAVNTRITM
jgi:hypothetical protein